VRKEFADASMGDGGTAFVEMFPSYRPLKTQKTKPVQKQRQTFKVKDV